MTIHAATKPLAASSWSDNFETKNRKQYPVVDWNPSKSLQPPVCRQGGEKKS